MQRVQIGDLERIRHQRPRARPAPRPHRAAIAFGPVDEVAHNQKVAGEAHFENRVDLKLQPLQIALALRFPFGIDGVQMQQPFFQAFVRSVSKVRVWRQVLAIHQRRGELGQLRLAQHQREVAAAGNLHRVGKGRRHIGKQRLHLRCGLEILVARELAHTLLVAQNFAFGNADARLVGLVVISLRKLHRVRRHHGQLHARGQLHGSRHMGLVISPASALQLNVEAVRKQPGKLQRCFVRTRAVALHQRLAHRPGLRARERNQPLAQFCQPRQFDDRQRLDNVLRVGPRQQLRQVQVALHVLHQHDDARTDGVFADAFQRNFGPQQRLDPLATSFFVELDGAKQVVQVSDGQGRLAVCGGSLDDLVNAVGAVDDGKLGVEAQMDEHGLHCRNPVSPLQKKTHT